MQMDDFLIPRLSIGACDDSLCVRVSRFWDFSDPNDEAKLLHIDMVLIDEEVCGFSFIFLILHSPGDGCIGLFHV
jgi:hypothetical protein